MNCLFKPIVTREFWQGDCLELMRRIPDGSVDMVLCDLPYGTVNWKSPEKWDKVLPMSDLWRHWWRILRPSAAVLLFGNEPFSTMVRSSDLNNYKYDLYWKKSKKGGFANAKVKPLKSVETISVFSKGTTSPGRENNMTYIPQGLVKLNKVVSNSGKSRIGMTVRANAKSEYIQEFTNYPDDVLEFQSESRTIHPTQKPVALFEYLIKTYTHPGETVLDNCAGSGTTAIAALNTGRGYICIEKDTEYYKLATERVMRHNG